MPNSSTSFQSSDGDADAVDSALFGDPILEGWCSTRGIVAGNATRQGQVTTDTSVSSGAGAGLWNAEARRCWQPLVKAYVVSSQPIDVVSRFGESSNSATTAIVYSYISSCY